MKISDKLRGIPPAEFVGRRVKFHGHENKQHGMPCLVMGIEGDRRFIVKPAGHKRNEIIDFDALVPTWSNNQDLLARYPDTRKTVELDDTDPVMTDPIVWAEPQEIMPVPATREETRAMMDTPSQETSVTQTPPLVIRQPRMTVKDHSADWLPTYQKYLEALKAEAHERAFLVEIHASINAHCQSQQSLIAELAKLGVDIVDEECCEETPAPAAKPQAVKKPKRRSIADTDRLIVAWGKKLKQQLLEGDSASGNVGKWTTELGITWTTLGNRLDMITKVVGILFVDAEGRVGNACRGPISVTLAHTAHRQQQPA